MASNAKNLAELLNQDSTVAAGDVADGSITTAKLAADAVTAAKLADNAVVTANVADGAVTQVKTTGVGRGRNLIINGDARVQQRYAAGAVTTSNSAAGAYSGPDRWKFFVSGGGVITVQQSYGNAAATGHDKAIGIAVTTADTSVAASDYYTCLQRIESKDVMHLQYGTSSAKSLTLSFWVRATKTGTQALHFAKQGTGTDYRRVVEYTVSASNTWEYKTITIPGLTESNGTITDNDSTYFQVGFILKYGSSAHGTKDVWTTSGHYTTANAVNNMDSTSNTFHITGVQLEVGVEATEYERIPFADQMLQCKRYCDITTLTNSNTAGCTLDVTNGVSYHFPYRYSTRMRIAPAVTYTIWTHYRFPTSVATFQRNGVEGTNYYLAANSTGYGGYMLGSIDADAEL